MAKPAYRRGKRDKTTLWNVLGDVVMLAPKDAAWKVFMEGLGDFTDDFFTDGREQGVQPERDLL